MRYTFLLIATTITATLGRTIVEMTTETIVGNAGPIATPMLVGRPQTTIAAAAIMVMIDVKAMDGTMETAAIDSDTFDAAHPTLGNLLAGGPIGTAPRAGMAIAPSWPAI